MEALKQKVIEYANLKKSIQELTDRKNELERNICDTMNEFDISTLLLPNGQNLNYRVKETLALTKSKKEKEPKEPKEPKARD